jgi:hypothetical protein
MTIEELRTVLEDDDYFPTHNERCDWFYRLAPELLGLVEAVDIKWLTQFQGQKECQRLFAALDAFNAKLAEL